MAPSGVAASSRGVYIHGQIELVLSGAPHDNEDDEITQFGQFMEEVIKPLG